MPTAAPHGPINFPEPTSSDTTLSPTKRASASSTMPTISRRRDDSPGGGLNLSDTRAIGVLLQCRINGYVDVLRVSTSLFVSPSLTALVGARCSTRKCDLVGTHRIEWRPHD